MWWQFDRVPCAPLCSFWREEAELLPSSARVLAMACLTGNVQLPAVADSSFFPASLRAAQRWLSVLQAHSALAATLSPEIETDF